MKTAGKGAHFPFSNLLTRSSSCCSSRRLGIDSPGRIDVASSCAILPSHLSTRLSSCLSCCTSHSKEASSDIGVGQSTESACERQRIALRRIGICGSMSDLSPAFGEGNSETMFIQRKAGSHVHESEEGADEPPASREKMGAVRRRCRRGGLAQ